MNALNIAATALSALACVWALLCSSKGGGERLGGSLSSRLAGFYGICVKYRIPILLLITALGGFMRFYRLCDIPEGIHIDEASSMYDGYTLAEYGIERFGHHFPVYLVNYGGGANALYAYLIAICVKLFGGLSLFAVRFPGALVGTLAIYGAYLLAREAYESECAGLVGAFVTAIIPVGIMSSRFGLEVYIMHGIVVFALFFTLRAVRRAAARWYFLAGGFWGLALYCYALSYIIIPCCLLLLFIALLRARRLTVRQGLAAGVPLLIFAIPLMLFLAVNYGLIPEINTPFLSCPKLPEFRGGEVALTLSHALESLSHLGRLLLTDGLPYNAVAPYYTMYMMSIPLVLTGLFLTAKDAVKEKRAGGFDARAVFLFYLVGCIIVCAVIEGPNINRFISVYGIFTCFAARALREIWRSLKVAFAALIALLCACFVSFGAYYFTDYTKQLSPMPYFEPNALEAYNFAKEKSPDGPIYYLVYRQGTTYQNSYIYPLIAEEYDPYDFQAELYEKNGSWVYGINCFYVPVQLYDDGSVVYEIYEDAAYVFKNDVKTETVESVEKELEARGFTLTTDIWPYNIWYYEGG